MDPIWVMIAGYPHFRKPPYEWGDGEYCIQICPDGWLPHLRRPAGHKRLEAGFETGLGTTIQVNRMVNNGNHAKLRRGLE